MRVELTNGHWAEIKDPERVPNRVRRDAIRAYETAPGGGMSKDFAAFDVYLAFLLESWSFEAPLPPEDPDAIANLDTDDSNLLYAALNPQIKKMFPRFGVDTADGSPTGPSKS